MSYRLYKGVWIFDGACCDEAKLTREEVTSLLRRGGYAVRNCYDFDRSEPSSFWFLIKDGDSSLETMNSKMRKRVRKALDTYDYRRVSAGEINENGYDVYRRACEGYKIQPEIVSRTDFSVEYDNSGELDFWAAYSKETGAMVAYSVRTIYGNMCEYSSTKTDPRYLDYTFPMYGMYYVMNRYYLEERGLRFVCNGARSITNHSHVQEFMVEKFGFRRAYCALDIHFVWWLRIAVWFLFPFRRLIKIRKVQSLLNMEAMCRNKI